MRAIEKKFLLLFLRPPFVGPRKLEVNARILYRNQNQIVVYSIRLTHSAYRLKMRTKCKELMAFYSQPLRSLRGYLGVT